MVGFLSGPFFTEQVLPFLLVFTLIFAILEKTKVLGDGKRQINAIIAFVVGLLLIAFPFPRSIVVGLMPLLAVIAVIFLVFIMLYTFASGEKEVSMPKGLKITFGILIALALIIALLVMTGYWDSIVSAFLGGQGSEIASQIFFVVIVIAAIAVVVGVKGSGGNNKE